MSDEIEIVAEVDWDVPVDELLDQQHDGRKGLPSASEYPRIWACPGFLNLKRKLPKKSAGASAGPYAESGRRIHAALAGDAEAKKLLTDEEEQVADWCELQWDGLIGRLFKDKRSDVISERRLFMGEEFSGQFDRTVFSYSEGFALTVDFKTGRMAVPGADSNLQMRAYAVLLSIHNKSLKKIYVAVIQPWVSKDPIIAEYDAEAIRQSMAELQAVLKSAKDPHAKRIPGAHCKYCPCRADCPEARSVVTKISNTDPVSLVTNEQIADFLELVPIAEAVIEAVKKEAESRLALGQSIDGWQLAPGRVLQTITLPEVVFARVSAIGVTQSGFMSTVKIGKANLKAAVKVATGLKGKGLEDQISEILSGCVEDKQTKSYLKRVDTV